MATRQELQAAADAGVIAPEQVEALERFLSQRATVGEEDLRFIRNFHDVFLSIGLGLLAIGISVAISVVVDESGRLTAYSYFAGAGVMWLLAEYFARRKRLFLPAITISIAFVGFVFWGTAGLLFSNDIDLDRMTDLPVWAAGAFTAAAALFWLRFRLPFSLLLVAFGTTFTAIAALGRLDAQWIEETFPLMVLGGGGLSFLAAVAFDARDPERATRASDNAFWLHMAAAPMILFGLIGALFGFDGMDPAKATAILLTVGALGLVALAINRRALLVSALIYTGVSIGAILKQFTPDDGVTAAATLLLLGAGVVLLGAGWHGARRLLLKFLPAGPIFPPERAA